MFVQGLKNKFKEGGGGATVTQGYIINLIRGGQSFKKVIVNNLWIKRRRVGTEILTFH